MILLTTAVHSAFRGYAWSRIPTGMTERLLDRIREIAAERRGDFPDPENVDRGIVAIGPITAAFSIRNVPKWDSAGRDSEYSAFAFFQSIEAARINFEELLKLPFFDNPTHDAPETVEFSGNPAEAAPLTAAGRLVCHRHLDALPAVQCGDLLAKYFSKTDQWIFRPNADGTMSVDCSEWKRQ